jgi:hypothetical protein
VINTQNHLNSIENLFDAVRRAKEKVYLIVDEYDSFANRLLLEIDTTTLLGILDIRVVRLGERLYVRSYRYIFVPLNGMLHVVLCLCVNRFN